MASNSITNTTAYRLVDQMVNHSWGYDTEWDCEDLVHVYREFTRRGGSWESIVNGDVRQFVLLEQIIDGYLNCRNIINVTEKLNDGS